MRLVGVVLLIWGALGGLFAVVVAVVYYSVVSGAAGVGTFAVFSYFSPNFDFYFATSAAAYFI